MSFRNAIPLILILIISSSCSRFVKKMAVQTTSVLLTDASYELETEGSWGNFKKAVLPNLKFVEALLYIEPENEKLLVTLLKGYSGYAFAVNETEYLKDYLQDKTDSSHKKELIVNYSKALRHGMKFLEVNDISWEDLAQSMNKENGFMKLLDENLDDDDMTHIEGALYTGQALGGLINFQKTNMKLVSLVPVAKGLFDWACLKKPDLAYGVCDVLNGAYEAGRPRMMGGNPELAKKIFKKMINKYPNNWLARVAYIQYFLIPNYDEDEYLKQKPVLDKAITLHEKELLFDPTPGKDVLSVFSKKRQRLFQAVAIERYKIIKKYDKDLF